LLVLCVPAAASAGNQDLYGFGTRGPGLGGAAIAFPRGYESVYYNPAGLTIGGLRTFAVAFTATTFALETLSPRPDAVEGVADEDAISGVTLGINVMLPLKGFLENRIAIGLGLYIPTETLLSARIPMPYSPQFSLVADRARALSIQAAIGVRIMDWLRVGGGVRVLAGLQGFIDAAPNDFGNLSSEVEDELVANYAGVVGIVARPHHTVSIGMVWRGELGAHFDLPVRADLGDLPLTIPNLTIAGETVWDPQVFALHIGYRPIKEFSMEVGVSWKQWSAYPIPILNTTEGLPPQEEITMTDTVVPRVGFETEHSIGAWRLAGRAGYAWEQSPVGAQEGRHNFLDSDRHIASFGFGFGWGSSDSPFRIDMDLYGQFHVMTERYFSKTFHRDEDAVIISDNAGVPWIGAKGMIYSFGAGIEVQL